MWRCMDCGAIVDDSWDAFDEHAKVCPGKPDDTTEEEV